MVFRYYPRRLADAEPESIGAQVAAQQTTVMWRGVATGVLVYVITRLIDRTFFHRSKS